MSSTGAPRALAALAALVFAACGADLQPAARAPAGAGSSADAETSAAPGSSTTPASDPGAPRPDATQAATPADRETAGAAGSGGSQLANDASRAPSDAPDAPQPPTGVVFDWPETDPTRTARCKPGHYVGEYACRLHIVDTSGDGAFDVSGSIDMTLEESGNGELLRIADGHFASATLAAIPMSADIVGELDCTRLRFEGELKNGLFSVALGLPIPFTMGTFEGPLSSDYDPDAAALEGSWNMTGQLDGVPGTCMDGAWSARLVP